MLSAELCLPGNIVNWSIACVQNGQIFLSFKFKDHLVDKCTNNQTLHVVPIERPW